MDLEQLKQSWDKLSERLEREEILRREELKLVVENKITTYNNRIKMNQYLGWLVLVGTVGLLFVQGIQNDPFGWIVIGTVLLMDIFLFAPMYRILKRLARFEDNIIEQAIGTAFCPNNGCRAPSKVRLSFVKLIV